jgi:chaperonin GroES
MKVKPLHDRVIVERLEKQEETVGGIIIPDTAKEKPQQGRVVAVGPGRLTEEGTRRAMTVRPGDLVIFGKYAGTEFKMDDKEYLILREDDIYAVLEEK